MTEHYCHKCSVELEHINFNIPANLTGSAYQLDKFIKHTLPSDRIGTVGLFSDPSYDSYTKYIVNSKASGSVEIDDLGRQNIIWYAGEGIGVTRRGGRIESPANIVKVVLFHDVDRIHCFPVEEDPIRTIECLGCGLPIILLNPLTQEIQ